MNSFTCITCQVAFKVADLQRLHYKTDWHRYNLKRKIAEFPPVTAEEFDHRVILLKQEVENKNKKNGCIYCSVCKKSFNSSKTFENHLQSKKHTDLSSTQDVESDTNVAVPSTKVKNIRREKVVDDYSDIETDSEIEEVDSDEWEAIISDNNPIVNNNCLFCSHHSASLTKNVQHMSIVHSFFIPDVEYLIDLKGLLIYLGEKICQGLMCIWCNQKSPFVSMESAQNHMVDKGHTKMLYSGEALLEYYDFYSYRNVDSDIDGNDNNSCNNDVSSETSVEINNTPDDIMDSVLVLPSGATIGHRSLMRYYKQNITYERSARSVACLSRNKLNKVMSYYRSLGWTPEEKVAVKKKVKDLKYMNYIQSKYAMKLGVRSNKFQPHFRNQNVF